MFVFSGQLRARNISSNQYASACVVLKIFMTWEVQRSNTQKSVSFRTKAAVRGANRNSVPTNQTHVLGASVAWKGSHVPLPLRGVASHDCPKQKGVNTDIFCILEPTLLPL